jgi:hypothetical protein
VDRNCTALFLSGNKVNKVKQNIQMNSIKIRQAAEGDFSHNTQPETKVSANILNYIKFHF